MRPVSSILSQLTLESKKTRRQRRLQAFRPSCRRYIAGLTACSIAIEDLADSFPAMLFALATGYATQADREACLDIVERGGSLKDASNALGLPLWTRRLPPEALVQSLPPLPGDTEFASTMVSRMPENGRECAVWLDRMTLALALSGRDLALWVAREPRLLPPLTGEEDLSWLMAWAWASTAPATPGYDLLRGAWSPSIGWKRARDEIAIWRKRVDLVGALAGEPRDPWFQDAHVQGLDIVHLDTVEAFIAESQAMENCLDQYAAHLSYGRIRVFSVRRDGRPIADVELTLRSDETTMPCISQIRGPRNRRAPPPVWQAVHAWLGAQPFRTLAVVATPAAASRDAYRAFWRPYLAHLEEVGIAHRLGSPMAIREARRRQREETMLERAFAIADIQDGNERT